MTPKIGRPAHLAQLGHVPPHPAARPRLATPFAALLARGPGPVSPRPLPRELHRAQPVAERAREREESTATKDEPERERERPCAESSTPGLEPMAEPMLAPLPVPVATPPTAKPVEASAATATQTLAPELLDQAAFWGDGSRGVARLRFGSRARGGLAGATVTLEHDGEALSLRIEGDSDVASALRERLARKGLPIED